MNLVDLIKQSKGVLIVGHMRPDGDCFGSGLAILRLCQNLQRAVSFVCDSELSRAYSFMKGYDLVNSGDSIDADLLIVVDCGDDVRMGKYKELLKKFKNSINIDHHITNNGFAKINIIDKDKSSTSQMVYELIKDCYPIDSVMAECLYVGLSTDTGHFMHNTTNETVFRTAAELISLGADPFYVSEKLYKSRTLGKTKLIVRAINSLRLFDDDSIGIVTVFNKDLEECDCTLSDTEGLIDYATAIASVRVAACVAQQKDKMFKVSLRSKGTNVAAVAGFFGGGGHTRAAGCMIHGFYEDVVRKLQIAITNQIECEK